MGAGGAGFLHLCICQRRQVGQGTRSRRPWPRRAPPFLTLTSVGCSGVRSPGRETAQPTTLRESAEAASSRGPREHAQAFYTLQCNFLFYFTLIMIIQEYYLR